MSGALEGAVGGWFEGTFDEELQGSDATVDESLDRSDAAIDEALEVAVEACDETEDAIECFF